MQRKIVVLTSGSFTKKDEEFYFEYLKWRSKDLTIEFSKTFHPNNEDILKEYIVINIFTYLPWTLDLNKIEVGNYCSNHRVILSVIDSKRKKLLNRFNSFSLFNKRIKGLYIISLNNCINPKQILMQDKIKELKRNGVIIESNDVEIAFDCEVGQDTIIKKGCLIGKGCKIGKKNLIGDNSSMEKTSMGDYNKIVQSCLSETMLYDNVEIGPYAKLRNNVVLENKVIIGSFVEIKNSHIGKGTKIKHLAYIGDTDIKESSNIGAGVVIANYDGKIKHKTEIGKNVFIGSNSTLVAPLIIEDNAMIAAGSTIVNSVPSFDLAIARQRQINKKEYAKKYSRR